MPTNPQHDLTPLIALLAFVGLYSIVGNPFDLCRIVALGVFGWWLRNLGFELAPATLGFVLGSLFENNLRRALSIGGNDRSIPVEDWQSVGRYARR